MKCNICCKRVWFWQGATRWYTGVQRHGRHVRCESVRDAGYTEGHKAGIISMSPFKGTEADQ